ncbi:MAG: class I SAM-dependent methyltransferase [Candidatus Sumerlaeia bacterium]|nr:class I SAM-dependent methyltransferase [Candidatus Sumerlaeia bacterium]
MCRKSPLHFHGDGLRLLDVGAGTGEFLWQMRELGWEAEGIEPDERALGVCREHGLQVAGTTIEKADLPAEVFDVVTVWQTLEHVCDPAGVLKKIVGALVPAGLLVGSIPNAASWNRIVQGEYWWGYDPPRHYVVFSPTALRKAFEMAGLRTRWVYCLSSTKGVFAGRAARARMEGRQFSEPIPAWALRFWVRLLDRLGLGDNLWFVGQKAV